MRPSLKIDPTVFFMTGGPGLLIPGYCREGKYFPLSLLPVRVSAPWVWFMVILLMLTTFYLLHRYVLRRHLQKLTIRYSETLSRLKAANQPEQQGLVQRRGRDEIFLSKARHLVERNLNNEHFGLEQLREGLGISRSHLHRRITSLTGASTTHFIRSIRLKKARDLLLSTELNISEVAYLVGFKSPAYFSQLFTEAFGKSPSDFRKTPPVENNGSAQDWIQDRLNTHFNP